MAEFARRRNWEVRPRSLSITRTNFDGIAIQVERPEHDLIGVTAEGRDALPVEDPVYADLQLFLARQPLGSHELEGPADDIPPLVYLFGNSGKYMNVLH